MQENDFYNAVGYELPPDVPKEIVSEGIEYYKHPAGIYIGFIGRLTAKYKDINGQRCDADLPGAKFDHYGLTRWIIRQLGTVSEPNAREVLGNELVIPDGMQVAELYFPEYISVEPKQQWSLHKKFANFHIPGHPNLDIVKADVNKPSLKVTNFAAFPSYYGQVIKWNIVVSKKDNPYIEETSLIASERISTEKIIELEHKVTEIIEQQRVEREAKRNSEYSPSAPPDTSASDLVGEFTDNDLPF